MSIGSVFRTQVFNTKLLHYNADVNNVKWRSDDCLELSSPIKEGDRVYLRPIHVRLLATQMESINVHFVLITGDDDRVTFENIFPSRQDFDLFVNSEKLIHWYAQDQSFSHLKITPIPLGIDYHTLTENESFPWGPMNTPLEQEKQLLEVRDSSKPFWMRELKCYSNWHFRQFPPRQEALRNIPQTSIYYEPKRTTRLESWKIQSLYAFVASPHGNGLDCHRTWEALVLGCIVVVKASSLDPLYVDLPVLILKSWEDLTPSLLHSTLEDFKNRNFNFDKLTSKYWEDLVRGSGIA